FERLSGNLRRRFGRRRFSVGCAALHAFLEALDRATEIRAHVAQHLRADSQHHGQKNDQPRPSALSTHVFYSIAPRSPRPARTSASSYTLRLGISPRTILQNRQLGSVSILGNLAYTAASGLFGVARRPFPPFELG